MYALISSVTWSDLLYYTATVVHQFGTVTEMHFDMMSDVQKILAGLTEKINCFHFVELVFSYFRLTKSMLLYLDLKQLLLVSCIWWCYLVKYWSIIFFKCQFVVLLVEVSWIFCHIFNFVTFYKLEFSNALTFKFSHWIKTAILTLI